MGGSEPESESVGVKRECIPRVAERARPRVGSSGQRSNPEYHPAPQATDYSWVGLWLRRRSSARAPHQGRRQVVQVRHRLDEILGEKPRMRRLDPLDRDDAAGASGRTDLRLQTFDMLDHVLRETPLRLVRAPALRNHSAKRDKVIEIQPRARKHQDAPRMVTDCRRQQHQLGVAAGNVAVGGSGGRLPFRPCWPMREMLLHRVRGPDRIMVRGNSWPARDSGA